MRMMALPKKDKIVQALVMILSLLWAGAAMAQEPLAYNPVPLGLWVQELREEAVGKGVSAALFDKAFSGFEVNERVIELDRSQPEGRKTLNEYLQGAVTAGRKSKARSLYQQHRSLLDKISAEYGVQPRFIVALWGIETDFGGYTGNMDTVHSLATLAYEGRRSEFFRDELLKALTIIQQGHATLDTMRGSWAGAMGQCQFMPSSFLQYAQDYNHDGRKDIWGTLPDVFASIANYLKQSGWDNTQTWGRKVQLPAGFNTSLADDVTYRPLSEWRQLGLRSADGSELPDKPLQAALTRPGDVKVAAYLVYHNYDVILKWNRSRYFATAVGTLSDAVEGR